VAVVGAGFGGIAATIELKKHGYTNITVFEAASEIGGTWHFNDYPGAACDVPSHLYSYSFAQRATWSRLCSPQEEILDYLRQTADDFGVTDHVRTGVKVTACRFDDETCSWTLEIAGPQGDARVEADAIVLATGQLNQPAIPAIEGLETFEGRSFHSARWDHSYELTGKRVAVVGTGASAVQFVPEIVDRVAHLDVFQRSGNWILPRKHAPYPRAVQAAFRRVPGLRGAWRKLLFWYMEYLTALVRHPRTLGLLGRFQSSLFMRAQLKDPAVRHKAWPDYTYGCKRVLFSSTWLPALQRPNTSLISDRIVAVTPTGPQTADGTVHETDVMIWATGFRTTEFMFPMEVTGTRGRSLRDAWTTGARAHLGITVSGFPSLFIMYGPNTNTSGGSIIFFLEAQAAYLRMALDVIPMPGCAIDVRSDVEEASTSLVQERFAGTAWTHCDSWYRDEGGRVVANWPDYMRTYVRRTSTFDPTEYAVIMTSGSAATADIARAARPGVVLHNAADRQNFAELRQVGPDVQ
jgi:cation diffusion facilitator CzcD-associated flavoprotein CzcO